MRSLTFIYLLFSITNNAFGEKYLFYLHGKIVEDQGANAVSPDYGAYKYEAILDTFRKADFKVMSEIRKPNTDVKEYAHKIAYQIDNLLKSGVKAKDITVIGASKGAVIAMYISTFLRNADVNFVFMAGCSDGISESNSDIFFYGNILSIYEKSDAIGRSCMKIRNRSAITHFKEIEINTGLQHGFLFQPLPEWVKPAITWARGNYK